MKDPENVHRLFTGDPQVVRLLSTIEGLGPEDAQWLALIDERCQGEVLSDLLLAVHQLAEEVSVPGSRDRQVEERVEALRLARETIKQRLAEKGRSLDAIQDEDIWPMEPKLELMKTTDTDFTAHTRSTAEHIYPSRIELEATIQTNLEAISRKVRPEALVALLNICGLHNNRAVVFQNEEPASLARILRLTEEIGQRVSKGYRAFVSDNPRLHPELVDQFDEPSSVRTDEVDVLMSRLEQSKDIQSKLRWVADMLTRETIDQISLVRVIHLLQNKDLLNNEQTAALLTVASGAMGNTGEVVQMLRRYATAIEGI